MRAAGSRAGADPAVIKRVRKLLRLAGSSNAHEAALAAGEARAVMDRHRLTEDEVAEEVVEVVEERRDPRRDELVRVVAVSLDCGVLVNTRGAVALRGSPGAVTGASALYRALVAEADARSRMSLSGGPPAAAQELWRICWWLGFVGAVADRLLSPRPRAEAREILRAAGSSRAAAVSAGVPEAVEAMEYLVQGLSGEVSDVAAVLDRLRQGAYSSGRASGERVNLSAEGRAGRLLGG